MLNIPSVAVVLWIASSLGLLWFKPSSTTARFYRVIAILLCPLWIAGMASWGILFIFTITVYYLLILTAFICLCASFRRETVRFSLFAGLNLALMLFHWWPMINPRLIYIERFWPLEKRFISEESEIKWPAYHEIRSLDDGKKESVLLSLMTDSQYAQARVWAEGQAGWLQHPSQKFIDAVRRIQKDEKDPKQKMELALLLAQLDPGSDETRAELAALIKQPDRQDPARVRTAQAWLNSGPSESRENLKDHAKRKGWEHEPGKGWRRIGSKTQTP